MAWKTGPTVSKIAAMIAMTAAAPATFARAEPCAPNKFAAAVDASGASLRAFNAEAQPKLKQRIRTLSDKKKWGEDFEDKAYDYLQDGRITEFDMRSNELLDKIDTLGRQGEGGSADCAALSELKAAADALLGVMKEKSVYLLGKVDLEIGAIPTAPAPTAVAAAKPVEPAPAVKPVEPMVAPKSQPKEPLQKWTAKTNPIPVAPAPAPASPPAAEVAALEPPIPDSLPASSETGYTIEEIQAATRGFFGAVSTSLAGVIEHTFSTSGRPTGYILGTEGGGALLAGLRYGEGTLYLNRGSVEKIYWHGPSIGTDFGASGSRTLFLIYKLENKAALYRSFTGIDGSAYLIGGVGVTLMKGGDIIMAPIRSGLGLRLGANIGYVRFTSSPTWNPF